MLPARIRNARLNLDMAAGVSGLLRVGGVARVTRLPQLGLPLKSIVRKPSSKPQESTSAKEKPQPLRKDKQPGRACSPASRSAVRRSEHLGLVGDQARRCLQNCYVLKYHWPSESWRRSRLQTWVPELEGIVTWPEFLLRSHKSPQPRQRRAF